MKSGSMNRELRFRAKAAESDSPADFLYGAANPHQLFREWRPARFPQFEIPHPPDRRLEWQLLHQK